MYIRWGSGEFIVGGSAAHRVLHRRGLPSVIVRLPH